MTVEEVNDCWDRAFDDWTLSIVKREEIRRFLRTLSDNQRRILCKKTCRDLTGKQLANEEGAGVHNVITAIWIAAESWGREGDGEGDDDY